MRKIVSLDFKKHLYTEIPLCPMKLWIIHFFTTWPKQTSTGYQNWQYVIILISTTIWVRTDPADMFLYVPPYLGYQAIIDMCMDTFFYPSQQMETGGEFSLRSVKQEIHKTE